jgi:hypothetical protein
VESEKPTDEKKKKEKKKFSWPIWKKLFQYTLRRKYHMLLSLALNIGFAMSVSLLPLKIGNVLD